MDLEHVPLNLEGTLLLLIEPRLATSLVELAFVREIGRDVLLRRMSRPLRRSTDTPSCSHCSCCSVCSVLP